jgi:uncharacterized protein (TIGR00369 family)
LSLGLIKGEDFMTEENRMVDNPYWDLIGLHEKELKNGTSIIELPIKREITQRRGTVHGGVLASMVDAAVGASIRSLLSNDETAATVEMKINYIRPAIGEKLIGKGKVINKGKTLAVGEAQILNDDGKVVASGTATYMIFSK